MSFSLEKKEEKKKNLCLTYIVFKTTHGATTRVVRGYVYTVHRVTRLGNSER